MQAPTQAPTPPSTTVDAASSAMAPSAPQEKVSPHLLNTNTPTRDLPGDQQPSVQLPPLTLDRDTMRQMGYSVIDRIVEHWDGLPFHSLKTPNTVAVDLNPLQHHGFQEQGRPVDTVLQEVQTRVLDTLVHVNHPRFMAYVPGPSNFVSTMGDALASGFNIFAGSAMSSVGAAQMELETLSWLTHEFGMPEGAGGIYVSGGTMANLTGLTVARHIQLDDVLPGAVAYLSDQTHASVNRALRILGFMPDQIRKIKTNRDLKIDLNALKTAIDEDRAAGRRPFCIIGNAGTTNTGTIDPLHAMADMAEAEGIWFHIDGAFGGSSILCEQGRKALAGIERADSIAVDPHKWMFQPYEIGCTLVKKRRWLKDTFTMRAEYLHDITEDDQSLNFFDYGPQLTRGCRALKLWMSLQVFGVEAFRQAVSRGFTMAEYAQKHLEASKAPWEILYPANTGTLNFRFVKPGLSEAEVDLFNIELVNRFVEDGFAFISTTNLYGKVSIRLCLINPRLSEAEVQKTLQYLEDLAVRM